MLSFVQGGESQRLGLEVRSSRFDVRGKKVVAGTSSFDLALRTSNLTVPLTRIHSTFNIQFNTQHSTFSSAPHLPALPPPRTSARRSHMPPLSVRRESCR